MEKVIYNLVFNRKKQLNERGKALIQVEAYYNRKKKYFSSKVYVEPIQWDDKRKVIKNHPNEDALNRKIGVFISDLERVELEIWQNRRSFKLEDLKLGAEENNSSFISFIKREIDISTVKKSTKKNHLSTVSLLVLYNKNLTFDDLSFDFLCNFEHFLILKEYHRNTVAKHLKHLKRYINLAINKDLLDIRKYPFRKFRIKSIETHREYLIPEELARLENVDLSVYHARYQHCLDAFLFSCYTGLRFSDVIELTADNIIHINNTVWLLYSTVKTDTEIKLPLFLLFDGKSLPILKRYRKNKDKIFDLPDNSNINKQLLKIAALAGINKRISFHTARHTNATILLYNGLNITTLQKLLGHKSVRTTQIYSNIMDMTVVRDLQKIKKGHK